ncbi:MAG: hypothetical protein WDW38_006402 [Sanguina aurantia]
MENAPGAVAPEIVDLTEETQVKDQPLPAHLVSRLGSWEDLMQTHASEDSVCPCCLHQFSEFKNVLQLICRHTLCRDCYQSHKNARVALGQVPLCPVCSAAM